MFKRKFPLFLFVLILIFSCLGSACQAKQPPQTNKPTAQKKAQTPGCVTLYEDIHFHGKQKKFCENTPYVGDDFNDIASSFRADCSIESFTLYEHRDYQGRSIQRSGCSSAEELPGESNDLFSSLKVKQRSN